MLNTLAITPGLNDLYRLINKVPKFPVTNRQLVNFAARVKAPKDVVDFYKGFSDNWVFESRDELADVSEQIEMMRQEEAEMPREIEQATEEY